MEVFLCPLSKEEFIVQNKLAEDCIILEPWEDFSPAIETVLGRKRIVYDLFGFYEYDMVK